MSFKEVLSRLKRVLFLSEFPKMIRDPCTLQDPTLDCRTQGPSPLIVGSPHLFPALVISKTSDKKRFIAPLTFIALGRRILARSHMAFAATSMSVKYSALQGVKG